MIKISSGQIYYALHHISLKGDRSASYLINPLGNTKRKRALGSNTALYGFKIYRHYEASDGPHEMYTMAEPVIISANIFAQKSKHLESNTEITNKIN